MTHSTDLAAKAASLTGQLAAIDDERQRLALQSAEGVAVAARGLTDLDQTRAKLSAELEHTKLARIAALTRERDEVAAEAVRVTAARREKEERIGHACVADVAQAEALAFQLAGVFKRLSGHHDEFVAHNGALPPGVTAITQVIPKLVMDILATSEVFAFGKMPPGSNVNGTPWNGRLSALYPPASHFIQTKA